METPRGRGAALPEFLSALKQKGRYDDATNTVSPPKLQVRCAPPLCFPVSGLASLSTRSAKFDRECPCCRLARGIYPASQRRGRFLDGATMAPDGIAMTALPRQGVAIDCQAINVVGTPTSTGNLPQPARKRTPKYPDWDEFRRARTEASNHPGPGTDEQQRGVWTFTAELMDDDIRSAYAEDIRRRS